MNTLYNSDRFAVVHVLHDGPDGESHDANGSDVPPVFPRHGFEIVDKHNGREVYLQGPWADLFEARIAGWQRDLPTQEEIEQALAGYAELAQTPIVLH